MLFTCTFYYSIPTTFSYMYVYVCMNMYLQVSLSGVYYTGLVPSQRTRLVYYWYTGNFFFKLLLIVYVYLTLYYTCKYTRCYNVVCVHVSYWLITLDNL